MLPPEHRLYELGAGHLCVLRNHGWVVASCCFLCRFLETALLRCAHFAASEGPLQRLERLSGAIRALLLARTGPRGLRPHAPHLQRAPHLPRRF